MPTYGNTSASSLLASAQAARRKRETLEDSIAAYEWDLSAKTQEDFKKYVDHLGKRATTYQNSDQARALEYQKKITSAQRGLVSAEISRATTQVLYGNMSNRQKYQVLTNLFNDAAANGDENLMQRLEAQAARLSITIQNEETAAANARAAAGARAGTAAKKSWDQKIKDTERDLKTLEAEFNKGQHSSIEYARLKKAIYESQVQSITEAANDPRIDSNAQNSFIDKFNSTIEKDDFKKFAGDGAKVLEGAIDDKGNVIPGANPYRIRVDPLTGERRLEAAPLIGRTGNEDGMNPLALFKQGTVDREGLLSGSKTSDVLDVQRRIQADPNASIDRFGMDVFSSENNDALKGALGGDKFTYYVDPVTNRTIVYDPNSNASRMPLDIAQRNKADSERWKNEMRGDGFIGNAWGDFNKTYGNIGNFLAGNKILQEAARVGVTGLGSALGGFVGGAAGLLGFNNVQGKLDKRVAELAAQKAAKEEADRQARAAESQRQAAEAQRILSQSRSAAAAKPTFDPNKRTVNVRAPFDPNYYIKQLPQPQRATAAIQNVLQSPFKKNSKLPF